MTRSLLSVSLLGALVSFGTGCPEDKPAPPPPAPVVAPPPAAPPVAPAVAPTAPPTTAPTGAPAGAPTAVPAAGGTGSVKGQVGFSGKAPELARISRKADAFCGKTPDMADESIVVNKNNTLKNVLVRVKGVTGTFAAPAAAATITQDNCAYLPRVQGVVAGQSVAIKNGDQTLHNVHTYKGSATLFNQAQLAGSAAIEKKFSDAGAVIKFKCDVHPWMIGFVAVNDSPFFAVTGDDGAFEIKDVPAGKYTVETWHEKFGMKSAEVTVGGAAAEAKFAYDGSEKAQ
ncbi:MAG: hypothetical protein EXR72_06380 [Myxococcales bacterium]|nr:hypothetical protein [Myxococcales bacterium]